MSSFWRNWFTGFCIGLGLFGVLIAGGAFAATTGPIRFLLVLLGGGDVSFDPALRFALAILGAVSIGWAISFHHTIAVAADLNEQGVRLWRGMTMAVLAWFVIDGILSVATGFALNVIPNSVFLAQFLIGVWGSGVMTRRA